MKNWKIVPLAACLAFGCDDTDSAGPVGADLPPTTASAVETYAQIVHASYEDSLTAAEALDVTLDALVDAPDADAMLAARNAWLAAREPYLQTEVYRFYDGPIDNPTDGPEGLLNAWPLDEAYIDYVAGDEAAGIVNDAEVEITADGLAALNEEGAEKNISTGYHAIEFLLWGQDMNDAGPGVRPFTDYVTDGSGTASNQARRGVYLTTASGLLLEHLRGLIDAWAPSAQNYRAEFVADPSEALRKALTGMIVLSGFETGGERLQTALDSGDQEDEHSCFSDNTHRDMVQDVQGVANVWYGSYQRLDGSRVDGTGIRDVVREVDAELASALEERIDASLELAEALVPPFDQEMQSAEGRARIQALIDSLRDQEAKLQTVFQRLGFAIPVVE